ncbi:MAG TPA: hypothetical protein VJM82_07840 [Nitrospiraceae bacterium]|nr:hypothetical protein [Nitrospiraceae bacterium]
MDREPQFDAEDFDPKLLSEFRERLTRCREANRDTWESSRHLVGRSHVQTTLKRLTAAVEASSSLPSALRNQLIDVLHKRTANRIQQLPGERLRQLTGLPPTKAVRALCILFGLAHQGSSAGPLSAISAAEVEQFVRTCRNPFDLLHKAERASLLDLGAGDLSFASELIEQYLPLLQERQQDLTVHCIDRLRPGSKLGGPLHPDQDRLRRLRQPTRGLQFQFWGDQDMFDLGKVKGLLPHYTIITCHAPATPTFALEPSRLPQPIIEQHLRKTKGAFRKVRVEGEEALEVLHGGRTLLFPPWKFEIRGPLALLDLLSRRGKLCVLSAVDTEVFWELLSQLVADPRMRPPDTIFSPTIIAELFGPLYASLSALSVGECVILSDLTELRQDLPRVLEGLDAQDRRYRFQYIEVRRGAVFEGVPCSQTARLFKDMTEEPPPWFLVLVPAEPTEHHGISFEN